MAVPSPDALLHLANLHLLSQAGFASTSKAASLTLSSVVGEYFQLVARASVDRANLAGRSKPGAYDVVESLEELGYGFRLDELYEYGLDCGRNVLQGAALGRLADHLEEGLAFDDPITELRVVETGNMDNGDEEEQEQEGEELKHETVDDDGDVKMSEHDQADDIPPKAENVTPPTPLLRFPSPDYSWLPPLPDPMALPQPDASSPTNTRRPDRAIEAIAAPASIFDRYKTRIPFSSSSIASQTMYTTPPSNPDKDVVLPPGSTSLPHLIATYAETKGEPTVNIRPNGYRLQALDLLRRQIASPDAYTPSDTLTTQGCVSGPRVTPIAIPPHQVPINPDHDGILSRLVHSIHSANLPPDLRERLTSLRPPLAQKKEGQQLYYGPGLRGADESALSRAQGKEPESEGLLHYATWDSGPRGIEKFSRPTLPRGKKVIKFVEGEDVPRQDKRPATTSTSEGVGGAAPTRTLRIKLGDSVSPAPPQSGNNTTPPIMTPGGTTFRLRIKRDSQDIVTPGTDARPAILDQNETAMPTLPAPASDQGLPGISIRYQPDSTSSAAPDSGLPQRQPDGTDTHLDIQLRSSPVGQTLPSPESQAPPTQGPEQASSIPASHSTEPNGHGPDAPGGGA